MPRPISLRNLIKKLRDFGFEGPYSGARHSFVVKSSLKLRIPNPHNGDISSSLVTEIIKLAEIDKKDWE